MNRIVFAYSGGLDTSAAIPWLAEHFHAEIVAVTLDLGQGRELDDVRERALAAGAVRAHVVDAREELASDFILPALRAGAVYEGRYPLSTALGRPLIAKHLVEIAHIEGATAVAHGCAHKGADRRRIEISARALDPSLQVIASADLWSPTHEETVAYARSRGIQVPAASGPYAIDVNLWGRSIEGPELDDAWREPSEEIYLLTKSPREAADIPAYVEIEFDRGVPIEVNGVALAPVDLITSLETIAGAHAVGRIDMMEDRLDGIRSREIYEAPAAVLLHAAHRELERLVTPRDLARLSTELGRKYADLIYDGLWYSPTRDAIDAFVAKVQEHVTGTIRLKLFKGDCHVVGRRSPFALRDIDLNEMTRVLPAPIAPLGN